MDSHDRAQMQNRLHVNSLSDDTSWSQIVRTETKNAFDELMRRHHPTALKVAYSIVQEPPGCRG